MAMIRTEAHYLYARQEIKNSKVTSMFSAKVCVNSAMFTVADVGASNATLVIFTDVPPSAAK